MKIQESREITEMRHVGTRIQERGLKESQMIFPLVTKRTNDQSHMQNMILSKSNVKNNWSARILTN